MIEKNFTVTTVRELVQYPNPFFTVINNMQKSMFNMLRELLEYILRFDLCLYKKNLNNITKPIIVMTNEVIVIFTK